MGRTSHRVGGIMSRGKAAEKKKPVRVAAGAEAPGFARSMGENTGRVLRPIIPLLLIIGAFIGLSLLMWHPIYGESHSSDSVSARGRLTATMIRAAIASKKKPEHISKEDYQQVADIGLIALNHSVFEANLSRTLAQAYEKNSWVERVSAVRLRYPAQIEVQIEWRKPAARVGHNGMVLDRNGYVLNLMGDRTNLPLISSVSCIRTETGKQVLEKDLQDALSLLHVIREALSSSSGNFQVASVQRVSAAMWHVRTDRGPLLVWGAFTDDPPMDEPNTREKVDLLRRRFSEVDPGLYEQVALCHASAPVKMRTLSAMTSQTPQR
jgi:hypothetical protein